MQNSFSLKAGWRPVQKQQAIIWSILSLAVMALIFWFSASDGDASAAQSNFITDFLLRLFPGLPHDQTSFFVRKTAHFSIYMCLAFCCCNALYSFGIPTSWLIPAALLLCALYAAGDEFHQTFTNGRSGQIRDVLIDSAGAFTGCVISRIPVISTLIFHHK